MAQDPERDGLWMAYLDGQLSVGEAAQFDAALSADDRARLGAEVRLESGLAEALAAPVACPDLLWKRTQQMLRDKEQGRRWTLRRGAAALATAAGLVLVLGTVMSGGDGGMQADAVGPILATEIPDLASFTSGSATPPSVSAAQRYLDEHGIHLVLNSFRKAHPVSGHQVELVGVCRGRCPKGTLLELRYLCCGKPVRVVVAREGTGGERMIQAAGTRGELRATRAIGPYIAAVIGQHGGADLLDVLEEQPPRVAQDGMRLSRYAA